jgi:hypothetical protein
MAGRPMRRSRGLPPRHEVRAGFWRGQIDAAGTPADQLRQCQRFLWAVAAHARRAGHYAEADAALTEAARAVADVAAGLEGRLAR